MTITLCNSHPFTFYLPFHTSLRADQCPIQSHVPSTCTLGLDPCARHSLFGRTDPYYIDNFYSSAALSDLPQHLPPPFSVIVLSSQYLFQRGPIWITVSLGYEISWFPPKASRSLPQATPAWNCHSLWSLSDYDGKLTLNDDGLCHFRNTIYPWNNFNIHTKYERCKVRVNKLIPASLLPSKESFEVGGHFGTLPEVWKTMPINQSKAP